MTRPLRRPAVVLLALAAALALGPAAPVRADGGYGGESVPALLADAAEDYGVPYGLLARISWCESRWNPYAVNRWSGAAGVFQWMPASWRWASYAAGYGGASRFDATANVRTAAWLLSQPGGSRHWRACGG